MINPIIDCICPIYPNYMDNEIYTPENQLIDLYAEYFTITGMPEAWRPVILYDSKLGNIPRATDLFVSTFGRIWNNYSKKFEIQRFVNNKEDGYLYVPIRPSDDRHITRLGLVHRLVMNAFYPIANSKSLQVNHLDEIKTHNWIWNLEWATSSENRMYSVKSGKILIYGEDNPSSTITNEQADKIGYLLSTTDFTANEICKIVGCSTSTVYSILNGFSRRSVFDKYDLSSRKRYSHHSIDDIHRICSFYQSNRNLDMNSLFNKALEELNMEDNDRNRRLLWRLYRKQSYKDICSKYKY